MPIRTYSLVNTAAKDSPHGWVKYLLSPVQLMLSWSMIQKDSPQNSHAWNNRSSSTIWLKMSWSFQTTFLWTKMACLTSLWQCGRKLWCSFCLKPILSGMILSMNPREPAFTKVLMSSSAQAWTTTNFYCRFIKKFQGQLEKLTKQNFYFLNLQ